MIIQGEDIKVRLTMTDGTSPIKPSDLDAYSVVVYYLASGKKTPLASFISTNTGAYGIVVFDDVAGKIDIVVNRDITPKIPAGQVYGEIYIKKTATSEFLLSKRKNGASSIELFVMEAAAKADII